MKKIRLVYYTQFLSIGGTSQDIESFCRCIDRDRFEVHVVAGWKHVPAWDRIRETARAAIGARSAKQHLTLWKSYNTHVPVFRELIGEERVHIVEDDGPHLHHTLLGLKPDVLHVIYSGRAEPPTSDEEVMSTVPVTVTTNAFADENAAPAHRHVKRIFFSSKWLRDHDAVWTRNDPRADYSYCPIELPYGPEDLRAELGIPAHAFVLGRSGRPSPIIHDPISLKAYRRIMDDSTWFVAVSAPANMEREAKEMGLKNFVSLGTGKSVAYLSKFYNTMDVMAHARGDGETFGRVIAEAMIHGKPVVSHRSHKANAQTETIGDGGYVVDRHDDVAYAEHLRRLKEDAGLRREVGEKARARAMEYYEARKVTARLEGYYESLLTATQCVE